MLRTERYKFVYYPHGVNELYDEEADPWEPRNLAGEPEGQPLREQLQAGMVRWMERADDRLRVWM